MKGISFLLAVALIAGMTFEPTFLGIPLIAATTDYVPVLVISVCTWFFYDLRWPLALLRSSLALPDGLNVCGFTRELLGKKWVVLVALIYLINTYAYLSSAAYFLSNLNFGF